MSMISDDLLEIIMLEIDADRDIMSGGHGLAAAALEEAAARSAR